MNTLNTNSLALAYLGDSIYEVYIRLYLLNNNIIKVNELQKEAIKYVSAKKQAKFLKIMIEKDYFSNEELDVIYRARNHKSHKSKSTDIITYKHATALEALIGYLYLNNSLKRIEQIMNYIVNYKEDE